MHEERTICHSFVNTSKPKNYRKITCDILLYFDEYSKRQSLTLPRIVFSFKCLYINFKFDDLHPPGACGNEPTKFLLFI